MDSSNNRLIGATYDPAGNLTAIGVQTYAYDPFSMMRQRGTPPDPDLYVYTASDERIGVRSGNYWLWSLRDASGKVIPQYESIDGAHMIPWRWVEDYVYRDGLLLGAERVPEEGGRRHFHVDHLGTPRLITGENGLTVSQHDYFPFGNEITPLRQETLEAVRRHGGVKYLQRTVKGPQPVVTPAGTTAPSTPVSALRQPATDALRPAGQATWESGAYVYDGAGNITNIGANIYVYDPLSRLKQANIGTKTEIYTYDGFGNLKGAGFPVDIDPSNNRLIGATYDPAGNLTAIGVQAYAYDPFSMMRQRGTGPDPDFYVYTASDERIGVRSGNYWLWSFRDASGKVIRQYESIHEAHFVPWRWVEDYVYRDGLLLGAERVPEEGGRRHFHLDHLGTPRLITGETGLTVSQHDYFPFGNEITPLCQESCRGFDREEPMKFTGYERDFTGGTQTENTNYLDYMHARSTNASWGRFLSVDPILNIKRALHNPQSWNRYAYVMNNPLKYTDPTGKDVSIRLNFSGGGWTNEERRRIIAQVTQWYQKQNVGKVYVFDGAVAKHGGNWFTRLFGGYTGINVSSGTGSKHTPTTVFAGNYSNLSAAQRINAITNSIIHETVAHHFGATAGHNADQMFYARDSGYRMWESIRQRYGTVADSYSYADPATRARVTEGPIPIHPEDAAKLQRELRDENVEPPDYDP